MKETINSKEYYIKLIKKLGEFISANAENILNDYDCNSIHTINIHSEISYDSVPSIKVEKEYIPLKIWSDKDEDKNK